MGEIAENCQGVKLVLVALKCDLREKHSDDDEENGDHNTSRSKKEKEMIDYKQGLEVARRIHALRYLGTSTRLLQTVSISCSLGSSSRMLSKMQPRGQRGLYGSRPRCAFRQSVRIVRSWQQMRHHVNVSFLDYIP